MNPRIRKITGTVLLLALIVVYSLIMMAFGATILPRASTNLLAQTAFYAVAGLAWVPPAMWIISWMHRGDKPIDR